MGLNSKKIKGNGVKKKFADVDAGTYPARLVQVIDLGLQTQRPFQGQEKPPCNEVMLTYELLDEFLPDENGKDDKTKPRWYSETIPMHNLQAEKAKSTKRYYALDPNEEHDGNFAALLGTPCMVTFVHNENKKDPEHPYVNITGISAMRPKEAAKAPELVNKAKVFDLDAPDVEIYQSLPDWLQQKIKDNLNFGGSALERVLKKAPKKEAQKEEDGEEQPW